MTAISKSEGKPHDLPLKILAGPRLPRVRHGLPTKSLPPIAVREAIVQAGLGEDARPHAAGVDLGRGEAVGGEADRRGASMRIICRLIGHWWRWQGPGFPICGVRSTCWRQCRWCGATMDHREYGAGMPPMSFPPMPRPMPPCPENRKPPYPKRDEVNSRTGGSDAMH